MILNYDRSIFGLLHKTRKNFTFKVVLRKSLRQWWSPFDRFHHIQIVFFIQTPRKLPFSFETDMWDDHSIESWYFNVKMSQINRRTPERPLEAKETERMPSNDREPSQAHVSVRMSDPPPLPPSLEWDTLSQRNCRRGTGIFARTLRSHPVEKFSGSSIFVTPDHPSHDPIWNLEEAGSVVALLPLPKFYHCTRVSWTSLKFDGAGSVIALYCDDVHLEELKSFFETSSKAISVYFVLAIKAGAFQVSEPLQCAQVFPVLAQRRVMALKLMINSWGI